MLIQRRWVQVPFEKIIGKSLTPEEAAEEYKKLREGNTESYYKLLYGHLRLGLSLVARYAARYPTKIDDLVGEMLFALTKGCRLMSKGALDEHETIPNVAGYLNQTVTGRLNRFLRKERLVPLGNPTKSEVIEADFSNEIMELIEKAVTNDHERRIIQRRLEGFSDPDIAQEMGIDRRRVHKIRQGVVRRIKEMLNARGSAKRD